MCAAVHPRGERPVIDTRYDHRRITDKGALEVTRIRNLGFEYDKIPGWAAKDTLLFAVVDCLRTENLVGHA